MSMPITAIWVLAVLGMGVLLVMQPQSSVAAGRAGARPDHPISGHPKSQYVDVSGAAPRNLNYGARQLVPADVLCNIVGHYFGDIGRNSHEQALRTWPLCHCVGHNSCFPKQQRCSRKVTQGSTGRDVDLRFEHR